MLTQAPSCNSSGDNAPSQIPFAVSDDGDEPAPEIRKFAWETTSYGSVLLYPPTLGVPFLWTQSDVISSISAQSYFARTSPR